MLVTKDGKLVKKNSKRKVFLVSATILQHFKGKQKFKITKDEIKKNKAKLEKENKELSDK